MPSHHGSVAVGSASDREIELLVKNARESSLSDILGVYQSVSNIFRGLEILLAQFLTAEVWGFGRENAKVDSDCFSGAAVPRRQSSPIPKIHPPVFSASTF